MMEKYLAYLAIFLAGILSEVRGDLNLLLTFIGFVVVDYLSNILEELKEIRKK